MLTLTDFLAQGYTAYHVTAVLKETLLSEGFIQLYLEKEISLRPGGKYFVVRADASLIAFMMPEEVPQGFQIAAAHSDSPAFLITGERHDGHYVRLSVERYGGPHSATWFDRPLKIAGRVFVREETGTKPVLYTGKSPVFIPTVAPHQNKDAENKVLSNPAMDLLPVFSMDTEQNLLKKTIAKELSVAVEDILSTDLYLTSAEAPTLWGEDFISAPRLDDLASVYGLLSGFLNAAPKSAVPVFAVFHGEEVGSAIYEGAASTFLYDVIGHICESQNRPVSALLARSFLLSVDNAHGVHPAHPELYHPEAVSYLNGGIVLKHTANRRYTTDAFSAAMTRLLCEEAGVPMQEFRNRADLPGGGTLGAIATTKVSVPAADIGISQFSMHSACETAGVRDISYLSTLMEHFFSVQLSCTDEGAHWKKTR